MGLDGVELVLEVERRFGITIPDARASDIRTLGDLADYLLDRARQSSQVACPTAAAFYPVRRLLIEQFALPKAACRPRQALATIFPAGTRRRVWRLLQRQLGITLPPLAWSAHYRWLLLIGFFALNLGVSCALMLNGFDFGQPYNGLFGCTVAGLLWLLGFWLMLPLATNFPASITTLGDLAHQLAANRYLPTSRPLAELEPWIWGEVCDIVVEVLNADRATLRRETSFVNDLGMG